jgi:two-component system, NtrC family, response regulator HydG
MSPKLLVIAGALAGEVHSIAREPFRIGRDLQNDLALPDSSVSREHCLIVNRGGGWLLRDLGSHNGTLLNGRRIEEHPLAHRDQIAIGSTVLQFLTEEEVAYEDAAYSSPTLQLSIAESVSLTEQLALADLHALLRVSTMLHSFHAMYQGRGSPASKLLEEHLLSLILEVIPATRGAILLYGDSLDEPSSLALQEEQAQPHGPVTLNRQIVKQVLEEGRAMLVEKASPDAESAAGPPRALLLAPLLIRGRACGLLCLEGAAFQENHLQLLVAISQAASMAMENAFHLEWLEAEKSRLEAELHPDHHMIGDSAPLRDLQRNIARAAQTNATVLILGETGTGKELVAHAIHHNSSRAGQPFVAVNCAALSETLLESELFGHEKGSFTGAVAQKKGRLEIAAGGSVFLDEIGEIPLALQVKLLRVLQERQMERVGGTQPVKLDIRLIAATNRNLEEEVRAGRFRQDLYYRLNVVVLKTPALRDRASDILPLAMHFAGTFGAQCGRRMAGISPEAQAYLAHYEWPGNIRELENAMERAVVLGSGDMIQLEDLPESIREIAKPAAVSRSMPLQEAIDDAKRQAIARAFEQARGDHTSAARLLGVHPNYLYRLMRNLGLR